MSWQNRELWTVIWILRSLGLYCMCTSLASDVGTSMVPDQRDKSSVSRANKCPLSTQVGHPPPNRPEQLISVIRTVRNTTPILLFSWKCPTRSVEQPASCADDYTGHRGHTAHPPELAICVDYENKTLFSKSSVQLQILCFTWLKCG